MAKKSNQAQLKRLRKDNLKEAKRLLAAFHRRISDIRTKAEQLKIKSIRKKINKAD